MNLICLMDLILLQTDKTTFNLSSRNETLAEKPAVQIHPNKFKNRIVFKVKTVYKLELLSAESMELLRSTKKRC